MFRSIAVLAAAFTVASTAQATPNGAFEDFDSSSASWFDSANVAAVGWSSSGGPDGGAYATTSFNFVSSMAGDTPVLFRAQDERGSSGGIFEGDYITAGVTELRFWIRHNGPAPLTVFTRFSGPNNFPGASILNFTPVASGVWTEFSFSIAADNPNLILEGSSFGAVFSGVGHLQIGISVPESYSNLDQTVQFDLDKVQLVPTPGAAAMLLLAGASGTIRRRR
jgi:hypothetical protein